MSKTLIIGLKLTTSITGEIIFSHLMPYFLLVVFQDSFFLIGLVGRNKKNSYTHFRANLYIK